jgi:hypothetical protein
MAQLKTVYRRLNNVYTQLIPMNKVKSHLHKLITEIDNSVDFRVINLFGKKYENISTKKFDYEVVFDYGINDKSYKMLMVDNCYPIMTATDELTQKPAMILACHILYMDARNYLDYPRDLFPEQKS